jgi:hypothetical protein
MQDWFAAWLALPIPVIFASLFGFYLATAALLVWLCFESRLSGRIRTFKGVVAPFFGSVGIIFGLLAAFLSNDIWDRNKQAERVVLTESDTLVALYSLSVASGSHSKTLQSSIRDYASAVVDDEFPRIALHEKSARTEAALNALLREVAVTGTSRDPGVQRTMLDMVLKVRAAHEERLQLSNDRTAVTKWGAVLLLALITQLALAVVHLEKPRSQAAALFIFTLAAVSLLGLLAVYEAPFEPPVFVPPGPIAEVLRQVPM